MSVEAVVFQRESAFEYCMKFIHVNTVYYVRKDTQINRFLAMI